MLKKRAMGRAINKYLTDNSNLIKKIRNIFMYERVLISTEGLKGQISIFIKGEKCQKLHVFISHSLAHKEDMVFTSFFLIGPVFLASCQVYMLDFYVFSLLYCSLCS